MPAKFERKPEDKKTKTDYNEESVEEFEKQLALQYIRSLKDIILDEVMPSAGPKNFEGEAINYLRQNNLPLTEVSIKEVSENIFKVFLKSTDEMVEYDEKTKTIFISSRILQDLEYGNFYWPALLTFSHALDRAFPKL